MIITDTRQSTRVQAPATNGRRLDPQMNIHYYDRHTSNRSRRVSPEPGVNRIPAFLKCKKHLNICTYNARTLNQAHSLGELALEAENKKMDIVAIQEHKLYHEDQAENIKAWDISEQYTLFTSSATKNTINASIGRIGVLCHNTHINSLTSINKLSS